MEPVKAKKHLGQHFLKDENIAQKIVDSLKYTEKYKQVLEIGPGMGVLTKYLIKNPTYETSVIEIDRDSIVYLEENYPELKDRIFSADFLKINLAELFQQPFAIIGNFPYNISTQILFKVLEYRNQIPEVVGMFQKEVAERIASAPRNKSYGILSVLLQAFYDIEYLFTVSETVFIPPPRVKSGVIRLTRNSVTELGCNETLFVKVVKAGFNQRRKTLRNALKIFNIKPEITQNEIFNKRAEELNVNQFVDLTNMIEKA